MSRSFLVAIAMIIIINVSCHVTWEDLLSLDQKSSQSDSTNRIHRQRRNKEETEECRPNNSDAARIVMSRICLLCHDAKSHFAPNTRAECHDNCFKNDVFRSCMKLFSGSSRKASSRQG